MLTNLLLLPTFTGPDAFRVVIESPRGSTLKLKFDPNHGVLMLNRPLVAWIAYPFDWGFVPSTQGPDGDPIDVFVMWDCVSFPGIVLPCRAVGVLRVEQTDPKTRKRERNDRVAALPINAPRWDSLRSVSDVSERVRLELEKFFLASVAFEGKELTILGWDDGSEAMSLIRASQREQAEET